MLTVTAVKIQCPECGEEVVHTLPERDEGICRMVHKCSRCDERFVSITTVSTETEYYKMTAV